MRVFLEPRFSGEDTGDGGIRRVVEAQRKYLPAVGVEVVDSPDAADLINSHIFAHSETAQFLLSRPDIPFVLTSHGCYWQEYDWSSWCHKANAMILDALRTADALTAPSEWVAQALRRNSLRQVTVIGHGITLPEWMVPPRKGKGKGYVLWNKTRIDAVCDPEDLNKLARRVPDVPFVTTFGDAGLPNLGITDVLPYDRAKKAVKEASVYLCTARETFGIGTLEAMAAGVPVLAWRWGGQTELVQHEVTGYLAQPFDYDDLEKGLRYCLANEERLGKAGQARAKAHYRWQDVIPRYAALYEEVLAAKRVELPRISVIVPAYNLAEHLPAALDSVAAQTEREFECIIVDDASPDGSGAIADAYAAKDNRFRVIHNTENQYLAGALNTGIAAARGKYILPLDADNELPSNTLEVLAGELDKDRSTHIAYGNVEFLEPTGRRWHSGWPMTFRADWQVIRRNMIPSTAMFRREVWELTGGYRRRFRTAEDADFWTRATSYGFNARMVTEADTLVYRNRDGSMSRQEEQRDWTAWYPWSRDLALPPAAMVVDKPVVPSCDPPLVAVIIPVGPGHEELYIDAIDSVDGQVFRHFELIVINDTGAPLRWVPSWARLIETKRRGVAAARNAGITTSTARLFLPLDADDTLEPYALQHLFQVVTEFGGYAYCDFYEMFSDHTGVWNAPEYRAQELISNGCLHAVTGLYRKSDWQTVGGFDETLPAWEDWDFQLKLANIGVCGTRVPAPLFTYRKETGMRREENYAAFEASKTAILSKWQDYFSGGKTLMGCNSCPGGGGGTVTPAQYQQETSQPPPSDNPADYVVVDYIGTRQGSTIYRAPSGQLYRFSSDPQEKQKYVRADDAEFFSVRRDFRVRDQSGAPHEVAVAG